MSYKTIAYLRRVERDLRQKVRFLPEATLHPRTFLHRLGSEVFLPLQRDLFFFMVRLLGERAGMITINIYYVNKKTPP